MTTPCRRRNEPRRDGQGGFLLTETLATFTISAFVLLGLVSASTVLLRTVDRSVAHVQDVDDLSRTMSAIERDVSSLTRARWNGYEPQLFVFQGGPNSLFFAHTQKEADGSSEMRVIALREIVSGSGTRLMRGEAHLSSQATGFDELRYGPQRELGTGPARLRFSYVASGGKTEVGRVREWRDARRMPAAIFVEAVTRDGGRLITSKLVPIRANADIGCLEHDESKDATAPPPPGSMAAVDAAVTESGGPQNSEASRSFCGRRFANKTDRNPQAQTERGGPSPAELPGATP